VVVASAISRSRIGPAAPDRPRPTTSISTAWVRRHCGRFHISIAANVPHSTAATDNPITSSPP